MGDDMQRCTIPPNLKNYAKIDYFLDRYKHFYPFCTLRNVYQ